MFTYLVFCFGTYGLMQIERLISVMSAASCSVTYWQDFVRSCLWQRLTLVLKTAVWENTCQQNMKPLCFFEHLGRKASAKSMIFHITTFLNFWGLVETKTTVLQCAPTFHVPGPWAWWRDHRGDGCKITVHCLSSILWLIWSLVCLVLPYLWAQACSTSAMVFGASDDRIRGPPLSWITTSSSILTPRPRKRSGAWSLSSPMYNPETKEGEKWNNSGKQSKNLLTDFKKEL